MIIRNDEAGNSIRIAYNRVELQLATESKKRIIGTIIGRTFYVKKKPAHLHVAKNAYGINHQLISNYSVIQNIHLTATFPDDKGKKTYFFTVEYLIEKAEVGFYSGASDGNDYERQYFITLEDLAEFEMTTGANF
jgi:hypothetical protein